MVPRGGKEVRSYTARARVRSVSMGLFFGIIPLIERGIFERCFRICRLQVQFQS